MHVSTKRQTLITITLLFIFAQASVLAEGYRNPPEGARAIGAFGGHRAFANDANATIHNSANLVDLEQPMVQYNVTLGYGRNTFKTTGVDDQTENPFFAIPGFSVAAPFKDGKYAIGLSSYVAYGRSVDWGKGSYFSAIGSPYMGSMMVLDFTPNFAMRLTDSLSIGIGADIYYGKVEQKQFLVPGVVHSKLTADGTALGWNAAITWKMTEKQRLSSTYRSPVLIKYKGDNEISSPLGTAKSDVNAKIEYPTIIALAYGVEFTDTLRAEIDAEWLDFSEYETLTINNPGGIGIVSVPQKLKDTWTIGIGGEWDFATNWTARSGFMYVRNPTPDSTYGALSPDEDQGVISFGLGYENENHAVDIGYAYGLFNGRTISGQAMPPLGNGANGKHNYNVHLLSLSYGYKF